MDAVVDSSKYSKGDSEMRRLYKNVPFIIGSLVILLVIGLVGLFDDFKLERPLRNGVISYGLSHQRSLKPHIYQFDVVTGDIPVPLTLTLTSESTSTSESESSTTFTSSSTFPAVSRKIPYIWTQVWESAGWIPQKLMVGKYSGRTEYQDILQMVAGRINDQQQRHILKYLAMHAIGGGWVAHSDTFPLHDFRISDKLPNNGKLTSYDLTYPCLMSGSAQEWLRMGRRLAEHAKVYSPPTEWTEAIALRQMQAEITVLPEVFQVQNVASDAANQNKIEWVWNSKDCHSTQARRAVHFRLDSKEDFEAMDDPGDMVVKWLSMWLQACERSDYFIAYDVNQRRQSAEQNKKYPFTVGTVHAEIGIDDKLLNTMNKMQSQSVITHELAMKDPPPNSEVFTVVQSAGTNSPETAVGGPAEDTMTITTTPAEGSTDITLPNVVVEPTTTAAQDVVVVSTETQPTITHKGGDDTVGSDTQNQSDSTVPPPPETLDVNGLRRRARLKGW
eukprot:CAMPEP_0202446278 /NCGR_PEP_ID=MMETSP1360-20130828/4825_1 /ASSEMBLY_ACC=CAM_ASM_000848 /TAXON_ID=515479 /ORGANISM="Licmophora paradoxa, Strain CCMP2313" /LENGTH=501 /DNA_ID=CAMNT_0049062723 /DNA_START=39 /DNA_END=1541 /DNA_ORIENTATION=-